MPQAGRLPEWFHSENALRSVVAYNVHKNFSRRQYGGTFQLMFGELAAKVADTGTDTRKLGRYAWTKFQGRYGHVTRILSVYAPCKKHQSSGSLTVMNQQHCFFDAMGKNECPRMILLEDLRGLLSEWRQEGERIIVFIDSNENMLTGAFHTLFTSPEIGMREVVLTRHKDPRWAKTATFYKGQSMGKWPIDGAYATPDLPVDAATWLAFMPHLGDHRFAVIDIKAEVLVGREVLKIVCPQA